MMAAFVEVRDNTMLHHLHEQRAMLSWSVAAKQSGHQLLCFYSMWTPVAPLTGFLTT